MLHSKLCLIKGFMYFLYTLMHTTGSKHQFQTQLLINKARTAAQIFHFFFCVCPLFIVDQKGILIGGKLHHIAITLIPADFFKYIMNNEILHGQIHILPLLRKD